MQYCDQTWMTNIFLILYKMLLEAYLEIFFY